MALYPGSFVHVTPSFSFPAVVYVDTDRRCPGFFADPAVHAMVRRRRRYSGEPAIVFHHADYSGRFGEESRSFDLLISQWAGPVGQRCRRYLKQGGLLLANDSHGDASLANLDPAYELVGVVNRRGSRHRLSDSDLDGFFVPRSGRRPTRRQVEDLGRGIGYTRSAAMYLFRRR